MSLITDGLLIAACLTAGLYCFVLSRRLKQFSSTEEGVGQQVVQLNAALEETRAALKDAQAGAREEAEVLEREIVQARKLSSQLSSLISAARSHIAEAPPKPAPAPAPESDSQPEPEPERPAPGKTRAAGPIAVAETDKVASPPAKPEDDGEDALDELLLDEALGAASGAQQLGFVPDYSDGPDESGDTAAATGAALPAGPEAPVDDVTDAAVAEATQGDSGENLLKVERMGL